MKLDVRSFAIGCVVALTLVGAVTQAPTPTEGTEGWKLHTTGVYEDIYIKVGDTIAPRFTMTTDTILRLIPGSRVVGRSCGVGHIYLRLWTRAGRDSSVLSADTVNVAVCLPRDPGNMNFVGNCYIEATRPLAPGCISWGPIVSPAELPRSSLNTKLPP